MMIGAVLFLAALKIQILEFFYARGGASNGGASGAIPIDEDRVVQNVPTIHSGRRSVVIFAVVGRLKIV